jgi:deoxyribodipyrimidine photo-lyase
MTSTQKSSPTTCIHIFRRDYRLHDNTTLIEACKTHDTVIPIFIFTHKQIDPKQNAFRSDNSVQFLCNSLQDLNKQLQGGLYIFYGDEFVILEDLIKIIPNLKTISFNRDYTKYSQERDQRIQQLCKSKNIDCLIIDDICLNPPGTILTTGGKVYTKFTPFWRASANKDIRKPVSNNAKNYLRPGNTISGNTISNKLKKYKHYITMDTVMKPNGQILGDINSKLIEQGGRDNGLAILKNITEWKDYNDEHDQLTYQTTHLSPYNKFGCISIREVYWAMVAKLGKDNGVVRQLFWRDFFYHLSAKFPEIYNTAALNPKYRSIKWVENAIEFRKWCSGQTGYPIVDACMRELNTTGYMHNRGRLIVSNFLCRLMHMDWHLGEKYFATKLYDYDPTQNNFGWQVSGANSSGTTSRPLEQTILNPWLQSSQFDKGGEYIKKWCPELKDVNSADLHKWDSVCDGWLNKGVKYIKPILDYKTEKEKNLKMYRKYL